MIKNALNAYPIKQRKMVGITTPENTDVKTVVVFSETREGE